MHIILTGATGTCGGAVLQHCISTPAITRVTVIARRPVKLAEGQEKVKVVLHDDFTHYSQPLLDQLKGAEGCIWALGISQTLVNKEEYVKITHDYAIEGARAFATLNESFKFIYVSGEGADPSGRTSTLFGKVKGQTEKDLHNLQVTFPTLRTFAVRPGLIDPEGDHLKDRSRTTLEVTMQTFVAPILRRFGKGSIIGTRPLAKALVDLVMGDGNPFPPGPGVEADGKTLSCSVLRKLSRV
ncbi:hypothetical protein BU17DRAFT_64265 [Hysterangium stoloniferum]|nr:hypothetical protein BU17DRAFT_64265 [Hysterangium stoloniferum]